MSKFRKQLVKLGEEYPQLREHIRPVLASLPEGRGRQASGVEIIIERIDKMVVEDDYERGEIGRTQMMDVAKNVGTVEGIRGLMQALGQYGLPTDPKEYYAMDEGRITVGVMETADGMAAGRREIELWKEGRATLYRADYDIFVKFARTWKPNPNDMQKALGIQKY